MRLIQCIRCLHTSKKGVVVSRHEALNYFMKVTLPICQDCFDRVNYCVGPTGDIYKFIDEKMANAQKQFDIELKHFIKKKSEPNT